MTDRLPDLQPTAVEIGPTRAIVSPIRCTLAAFAEAMRSAIDGAYAYIRYTGLKQTAPSAAMYDNFGDERISGAFILPVAGAPMRPPQDGVTLADLPARRMMRFTHRGPYDNIAATYSAIARHLMQTGRLKAEAELRQKPFVYEYFSNPATTPEEKSITYIYIEL
jgi:hypothetical protein